MMDLRENWVAIAAIVVGCLIIAFSFLLKWLIGIALITGGIVAILNEK